MLNRSLLVGFLKNNDKSPPVLKDGWAMRKSHESENCGAVAGGVSYTFNTKFQAAEKSGIKTRMRCAVVFLSTFGPLAVSLSGVRPTFDVGFNTFIASKQIIFFDVQLCEMLL